MKQQVDDLQGKADKLRDDLNTMMRESNGGPAAAVIGALNQKADALNAQLTIAKTEAQADLGPKITAAQEEITTALEPVTVAVDKLCPRAERPLRARARRTLSHPTPRRRRCRDPPPKGSTMSDDTTKTPENSELTADVTAVSDGARTLFIADFNDTSAAHEAYQALKSLEDGRHFAIDGVVVVNRDADGKLEIEKATDHSTKRGTKWGLVGGAALGLVFPPSIIGSAVALGAGGAALGKAHQLHDKIQLEKDLSDAVAPGHSGIIALVSDPGAVEIREALAKANGIVESAVSDVVAKDIHAIADEVEKG